MRGKIFALILGAALAFNAGCAAVQGALGWIPSDAETIQQGYYESYSHWLTLKETAVRWAETPAAQARPEILDEFVRIDNDVQGVLDRLAEMFCLASAPTPDDPAPPPLEGCVPITGIEAEDAYLQASSAMRLASAELRRYLVAEGVER